MQFANKYPLEFFNYPLKIFIVKTQWAVSESSWLSFKE